MKDRYEEITGTPSGFIVKPHVERMVRRYFAGHVLIHASYASLQAFSVAQPTSGPATQDE